MENLQPQRVFYYFSKLMEIPRVSHHEKEVSDYLIKTGKELGLFTYQDENLNVILRRDAAKGYENAPKVIIQGHMDMVGSKTEDSTHDFTKDPIIPVIEGDYLKAKDTTLGADNGIAVAMGLALLEDKNYKGPQLELVVTTDEETSMSGALALADDVLEGEYLINLDSEEEGILTVGSAGGITFFVSQEIGELSEKEGFEIKLSGLLGGHSGMQIHEKRGNAVKILGQILEKIEDEISIGEFTSGTFDNVIPSSGNVLVFDTSLEKIEKAKEEVLKENSDLLGNLQIEVKEAKGNAYSKDFSKRVIKMVNTMPTGVNTFMKDGKTVESSDNLALIKEEYGNLKSEISLRSSNHEALDELREKIGKILDENSLAYTIGAVYPGWEYNENSKLRPLAEKVYKEMEGKEFDTIVIHAGLECGCFYEKYPHLDIISIGPNISGAHSPEEKLEIKSCQRVFAYVKKLLEEIK